MFAFTYYLHSIAKESERKDKMVKYEILSVPVLKRAFLSPSNIYSPTDCALKPIKITSNMRGKRALSRWLFVLGI